MSGGIVVPKKRLLEDSFDITPTGIQFCFDRELFLRDEFNVDKFVMRQKKVVSLEILREDLMQYFNILKNSLVELINQDYADFVNLSTNLVGLDKVIGTIEAPIEKEKMNIEQVRNNVDSTLEEISKRKSNLKLLREKRELIHCIENVKGYVMLLEKRLGISCEQDVVDHESRLIHVDNFENPLERDIGQKLEVVGYEFMQLEYFTDKCMNHNLIEKFKQRIQKITQELQTQLEQYLIVNWKGENKRAVQQGLRTYSTINKISVAEQLHRDCFVHPELERLISSKKQLEQDISLLYKEIMEIVDKLLNNLHIILTDDFNKYEVARDYDFLVNSIFTEVVYFIIKNMPQIFSPGNPDLFYQRYVNSLKFIDGIEERCTDIDQLTFLRKSKAYKDFYNKWSVPVYFQIRYQEIASLIDRESVREELLFTPPDLYNFSMIGTVHKSITRCWQEGIYLDALRHRFWKLTLQLINFVENYVKSIDWNKFIRNDDSSHEDDVSKSAKLIHIKTLLLMDLYRFLNIKSMEFESISNNEGLVWIYHSLLMPTLEDCLNDNESLCIRETLNDSTKKIINIMAGIICSIQSSLLEQSLQSIKAVFDIPRQYRRTNRPWPTVPSNYVNNILKPISQFLVDHGDIDKSENLKNEILKKVIIDMTMSYQEQIKDLLNSIKKMEDSLKMFKRTRGSNNDQLVSDKNVVSMSDDDKIRRQVQIDVEEFQGKSCQLLGCSQEYLPELTGLTNLVREMSSVSDN